MVETSTTETTSAETNQNLGYADIVNEIVDNNSSEEKELVEEINASLSGLECGQLADNSLEKLTNQQLSTFLAKNYFEGGAAKSYADCKNSGDILNFSMKAALQFLSVGDIKKYDESGKVSEDENAKSIDDWMKEKGGITLDEDSTLVKILQNKVGAVPDGKPGPQTIALTIGELGGDIDTIGESVDSFYGDNEKFKVMKTISLKDVDYKFSPSIKINTKEDGTYIGDTKIDLSGETPSCDGYTFDNGVIKKVGGAASENASESADANMKEFSHGGFKFKYDDNNIYVSNGSSGDIYLLKKPIDQYPTQNKLTISNLVPSAQGFEFVKNGDGNDYTIKLEGEDNFKDNENLLNKNIFYNNNEIEVQQFDDSIKIRKKGGTDGDWRKLNPASQGVGYDPIDGFIIDYDSDTKNLKIRLEKAEDIVNKQKEILKALNSSYPNSKLLAFKGSDGNYKYLAYGYNYNNNKYFNLIDATNKSPKEGYFGYHVQSYIDAVRDFSDIGGKFEMWDITYKDARTKDVSKKTKWNKNNRTDLYDWYGKSGTENGRQLGGADFQARVKRYIPEGKRDSITVLQWMCIKEAEKDLNCNISDTMILG